MVLYCRAAMEVRKVFVGGAERSGTTMVGSLLAERLALTFLPEAVFFAPVCQREAAGQLPVGGAGDELARAWRLDTWSDDAERLTEGLSGLAAGPAFERLVANHRALVGAGAGDVGWVEHSPHNLWYRPALGRTFPDAAFVYLVRDGRAVYASSRRTDFGTRDPVAAAMAWLAELAVGLAPLTAGDPRVTLLRYEDVVADPDAAIEAVRLAYDLPVRTGETAIDVGRLTPHYHSLVGQAAATDRVDAYRSELPERDLRRFESVAGPVLESLGYGDVTSAPVPRGVTIDAHLVRSGAWRIIRQAPARLVRQVPFRVDALKRRLRRGAPDA